MNEETKSLRSWISDLLSGKYINCVYCGHRYGPSESTPVSMADVLREHVEKCPKHPLNILKQAVCDAGEVFEDKEIPAYILAQYDYLVLKSSISAGPTARPEKECPMDFSEALKAMNMGCKVRRMGWGGGKSWVIKKGDNLVLQYAEKSYSDSYFRPRTEDILADDWWLVT